MCDSKLSGLHPFGNTAISLNQETGKNQKDRLGVKRNIDPWSNFCDTHWELVCYNKWNEKTSEISTPEKIVAGTH